MTNDGPLKGFKNWYHFQARYGVLRTQNMGARTFKVVTGYQNLDELQEKFAPYVLRRTKAECLDLPSKTYLTREVALDESTWRIYTELKKEALLALSDTDVRPEPNAAVRILRLCQLTSGHVGLAGGSAWDYGDGVNEERLEQMIAKTQDVSSEKLDWLVSEILEGELSNEKALIVWCRWRRERERLKHLLLGPTWSKIGVCEIYGGQSQKERDEHVNSFMEEKSFRCVLLAQPHAGGFGLTLTAARTAVYLSNDFSQTTRVQSEDRIHRIGQKNACTYVDVLATGPKGQQTIDHYILKCLREKKSLADTTCAAWKAVLDE